MVGAGPAPTINIREKCFLVTRIILCEAILREAIFVMSRLGPLKGVVQK